MSKHEQPKSNENAAAVNKAVAELLQNLTAEECFNGLNKLFAGYLRSDFSDDKQDRMFSTYTYETFRDLTLSLMAMEKGNRTELLNNLKNS